MVVRGYYAVGTARGEWFRQPVSQKGEAMQNVLLVLVTDCGGSDQGRYEIAAGLCFAGCNVSRAFFATGSMNPLHSGFTGAAHALSTVAHFSGVRGDTKVGILINAAPRHGTENGHKLRGNRRKASGEEIYALELRDGTWVVGPNAGLNLYFVQNQVVKSFLVRDSLRPHTPFRSMEVMVPALAKVLGIQDFPNITLTPKVLRVSEPDPGVYVVDWDDHGNIYLWSTGKDDEFVPALGRARVFKIGDKIARLRHVSGIFAGKTGEQTITQGSLKLADRPIYYIVVVGGSAHNLFGSPRVGTRVERVEVEDW